VSNSLNTNPIVTTGAQSSYKAAVAASLGTLFTLRVREIRWLSPNNVGDVLLITDPQSGQELCRLVCSTAKQDVVEDWNANPHEWRDFAVTQQDSGRAYIHTV